MHRVAVERILSINPLVERRRQTIQDIIDFVDRCPGRYESKVVNLFALKTGFKPRTVSDYIDVAVGAEILERHDRRLYVKDKPIQDPRPLLVDLR